MPKKAILLITVIAAMSACSSHKSPPGGVIVDMKGVDPVQYNADLHECMAYADQVDTAGKVGGNAAGGAVVGGGARGVEQTAAERHQVVANCLRRRGYAVLN